MAGGDFRPVSDLVRIKRRQIFHSMAAQRFARSHHRDRVRHSGSDVARAIDRIERDIEARRSRAPSPKMFPEKNAGRIVLDSLPDNHFAGDIDQVEFLGQRFNHHAHVVQVAFKQSLTQRRATR